MLFCALFHVIRGFIHFVPVQCSYTAAVKQKCPRLMIYSYTASSHTLYSRPASLYRNQLSPSLYFNLHSYLFRFWTLQCSCIPIPRAVQMIMAGKGSAWELASLGCLFHCYSVMNIPDGVYPEKYNYTYSPCRPIVCNSTTGETAAVSGWSCNATVKQYGLYSV